MNYKDITLWLTTIILTATALYLNSIAHISAPIKAIFWILLLIVVVGIAYLTSQGKRAAKFMRESKIELLKVVWPTRQETIQTTSIVMVMVAVTGFILWGIDSGMMWFIGKITRLG